MNVGSFGFALIFVAMCAFGAGTLLAWDAGFTVGSIKCLYIGLFSLAAGMLIGGWPWGFVRAAP